MGIQGFSECSKTPPKILSLSCNCFLCWKINLWFVLLSKRRIFRGQSVTPALFYGISGYLSAHEKLRAELNCPSGMWINHILHFKLSWARNGKIPLQLSKPKDQFQGDKKLSDCPWHPFIQDLSILQQTGTHQLSAKAREPSQVQHFFGKSHYQK